MAKVTKDMIIADVLKLGDNLAPIFLNAGLRCAGCPSAQRETLEDAGEGHGVDVDALVKEINTYLEAQGA
jgi:hybrid cluster-associated redox disulfide protein